MRVLRAAAFGLCLRRRSHSEGQVFFFQNLSRNPSPYPLPSPHLLSYTRVTTKLTVTRERCIAAHSLCCL